MLIRQIVRVGVFPLILVALAMLGTVASAMPALTAPDFAPVSLIEEYWAAEIVRFSDGRIEPGTSSYRIDYHDRSHWQVVQTSHSFQPERAGTTWTFDGSVLKQYDALRRVTRILPHPDAPDNWLQPGQMEALSRRSGAEVRDDSLGRRTITWTDASASGEVSKNVAVFDRALRIPVRIEEWEAGHLVRKITFTRV